MTIQITFLILLSLLMAGCKQANTNGVSVPDSPEPKLLTSTNDMQTGAADADVDRSTHPGKRLYEESCDGCHDGTVSRAPHFSWLEMMNVSVVYHAVNDGAINDGAMNDGAMNDGAMNDGAMNDGAMSVQAEDLADEDKRLITEYLIRTNLDGGAALNLIEPLCVRMVILIFLLRPRLSTGDTIPIDILHQRWPG